MIAVLALYIPVLAQDSDSPTPGPLILTNEVGKYPLGRFLGILEDPGGELTIEQVSSPAYDDRFILSTSEAPNFGFTDSAYWVRFQVRNESTEVNRWLVEVGFPNMHYVDLYYPDTDNGQGFVHKESGVMRPVSGRELAYQRMVFYVPLEYQQDTAIYMRFQNGASMTLPLTLWSSDDFIDHHLWEALLLGTFYGMLLIMLIYNLFLLYSLRDRNYAYFILFLCSMIFLYISYDGLLELYLWPSANVLKKFTVAWPIHAGMISILLFTESFLDLRRQSAQLQKLLRLFLFAWLVQIALVGFIPYQWVGVLFTLVGSITFGVVLVISLMLANRGYLPSRYFVVSWLGIILGGITVLLVRYGAVSSSLITEQSFRIGLVWLVAFWAVALADRINLLKAETEHANRELQTSEARYRQLVETMNDGLGVIDEEGRYTFVNDRLGKMLGYQPDEMVGRLMTDFVSEINRQILTNQLAKRKTGATQPYELNWRCKDGSDLYSVVSPMPLFGDDRQFKGAFAVITDITERVLANRLLEQRVTERTRELSTLLEISHEMTTIQELDYLLNRILERLKSVVGYRCAAILMAEADGWKTRAYWPVDSKEAEKLLLSREEAHTLAQAFEPGKPAVIRNTANGEEETSGLDAFADRLSHVFHTGVSTWLCLPLLPKENLVGILIICTSAPDGFSDEQTKVAAAFANQAAIVIENNQLIDQVQATAAVNALNRLARDLHDSVTQVLFSASMIAEVLPRIWQRDPEEGQAGLRELRRLTHGALAEMRTLLLELRPSAITTTPLNELVTQLTEAVTSRTEISFHLFIEKAPILPAEVQTTFYRVTQEALNNVVKHAQAHQVGVSLNVTPSYTPGFTQVWQGEVRLTVSDDGPGFIPGILQGEHFGLGIMRERAAAIDAILTIESQPGQGTAITLVWNNV